MQQPTTQTVYDLFNGRIQFEVPIYQRAYVWTEEQNWAVLWDDICDTANRYLEDPSDPEPDRHFLGPIVLDQQHTDPGGVDRRLVIDGQQRLTTLQIIISAAAAVALAFHASDVADELGNLTANRTRTAVGALRYKVLPARRDREAFREAIDNGAPDGALSGIGGSWRYFHDHIRDWVTDDGTAEPGTITTRIRALQSCLESLIYVVSINLDQRDNAQVIFETLNARGTGLGALDLVKNAVFLQGQREKAPTDHLHDHFWEPTFEADDYWLAETRQGRETRVRADWFLMHWLAMELGVVVRADKVFDTFRKRVLRPSEGVSINALVPQLCDDARIMRSFDDFTPGTPEQLFFSRLAALDTTTMLPIALFLFRTKSLDRDRRIRALRALESWLVRRAILRYTAKNYNRSLTNLLKTLKRSSDDADIAIATELRSSEAATGVWPSDAEVRSQLLNHSLYGALTQARVRMLLEACELYVRDSAKTEAIALPGGLTIEHAMPQAWEEDWALPPGTEEEQEAATLARVEHVHRLGNLTLTTQPLNSALSNAAWLAERTGEPSKRDELQKRSVLLINQLLCRHDSWDERGIDARGAEFTEAILATWPGPDSPYWQRMEEPAPAQFQDQPAVMFEPSAVIKPVPQPSEVMDGPLPPVPDPRTVGVVRLSPLSDSVRSARTFNDLLRLAGLTPSTVRLARHTTNIPGIAFQSLYEMWRANPALLEEYQRIQAKHRLDIGEYVASFIVSPPPASETIFIGLYRATSESVCPAGMRDPWEDTDVGGMYWYGLERDERMDDLRERVIIDWGSGYLAWCQRAEHQEKPILRIS